jgi:hypothetical protein
MFIGEGGLLSMPYLSVKARRSSEIIQNMSEKPSSAQISKEKVYIYVYIYMYTYIFIYIYIYIYICNYCLDFNN